MKRPRDGIWRLLPRLAGTSIVPILRNSMTVITIGVGVKALALVKERAVAHTYGATAEIDGYLLAFAIPSFALTIFSTSFATALVPELIAARRRENPQAAAELAQLAIGFSLCGAALLTAVLAVAGEALLKAVAFGFEGKRFDLAVDFYYVLLIVVFFGTLKETLTAVLTTFRRFTAPAIAPAVTTMVTLGMIGGLGAEWGVFALATGTSLGLACEVAFIAFALARSSLPFTPRWRGMARRLRPLLGHTRNLVLGAVLMGGASIVDVAMATLLDSGEVAILSYGTRLTAVAVTLIGAMTTVCLPYFSGLATADDSGTVRRTFGALSAWVVLATIPVVILLVAFSGPLIQFIYEGGSFSSADTAAAARVQAMFALQAPFYVLTIMGMRFITAFGRNDVVALISLLFFLANAAGNWVLLPSMGAAGIALATSLAYAISAATAAGYLLYITRGR